MAKFTTCDHGMLTWQDSLFLNEIRKSLRERAVVIGVYFDGLFPDVEKGATYIQAASWIYEMQSWIDTWVTSFLEDGYQYEVVPTTVPVFYSLSYAREEAGLAELGWTRKYPDGAGGITEDHGYCQTAPHGMADFIGHWIWDELQRMIDVMRWTALPSNMSSNRLYRVFVSKYGQANEDTAEFAFTSAVGVFAEIGNETPANETMFFFSATRENGTFTSEHSAIIQSFDFPYDDSGGFKDGIEQFNLEWSSYCFACTARRPYTYEHDDFGYKDYMDTDYFSNKHNGDGYLLLYPDQERLIAHPSGVTCLTSGERLEDHPDYSETGWYWEQPYDSTDFKPPFTLGYGADGFRHSVFGNDGRAEAWFFIKWKFSFTR